ncbi:pyruvate dehydrogenase (acetyl-transferring) E1 component subunit alpha [Simkania negevensis]|uniref:Pyruvate dehydrogenase (Acetyl-transferring) E1 component subunit alpha n=1 Tax=Simkania negevensis TaxID=83561 RepID=A0ABS3ASX7_9BACT|nr:pyruvate dehydrogenase (acetyl-transferring) E1 component subunit alpha [Simkania negevensis]
MAKSSKRALGKTTPFFSYDKKAVLEAVGKKRLLHNLRQMLLIRHFEVRGESAYQQGKVGGFYHSYMGQEAIQVAAVEAMGVDNWWATSYRCHALALLLDVPPNELMAELYGKATGNAMGRGGSMHFFASNLLGGGGIVGGQIPLATGAGFAIKYRKEKGKVSVCFLGDGAVAQGSFHESLNIAALWSLPVVYVVEENMWGMGTATKRAIAADHISKDHAMAYGIDYYDFDGMDYFCCYAGFKEVFDKVEKRGRPVLIGCHTQRFRGHSISDPALYRPKEELKELICGDPITLLRETLMAEDLLTKEQYSAMDKEEKESVLSAMKYAEESPFPDPATLEEDVFAP